MKQLSLFLFILLQGLFFQITAQTFKAGAIAGINTSQVSGDNLSGFTKPSPIAGLFVERMFGNEWSMQMELTYMGKGSRKNIDTTRNDFTLYRLNMHYAEIPLLLKYNTGSKLLIEFGPSFGYLIMHRELDEFGEMDGQFAPAEQFKRFDLSAALGLNYLLSEKFVFGLRLVNSLLPVRDHDGNTKFRLNRGQYHTGLAFRFHYYFK